MWWKCENCEAEEFAYTPEPRCSGCHAKMTPSNDQAGGPSCCAPDDHEWEWIIQPSTPNGPEERFKVCRVCGMEYPGSGDCE